MSGTKLREGGLYLLPNGQVLILLAGEGSSYLLCSSTDQAEELVDYRLSQDGRIYHKETRTNWSAEHLIDTGRTIEQSVKKASIAGRR